FSPSAVKQLHEGKTKSVNFTIHFNSDKLSRSEQTLIGSYRLYSDRPDIADVVEPKTFEIKDNVTRYDGSFQVKANFLGYSRIEVQRLQPVEGVFASLYSNNDTTKK